MGLEYPLARGFSREVFLVSAAAASRAWIRLSSGELGCSVRTGEDGTTVGGTGLAGAGFSSSSSSSDSSSELVSSSLLLLSDSSFLAAVAAAAGWLCGRKRLWKGFFSAVGDAVLRAGSEFFRMEAFGLTSSVARVGAGAGDALPDSLEELESLLAERVVFLAGDDDLAAVAVVLLVVVVVPLWRERLERSESSWSLSA